MKNKTYYIMPFVTVPVCMLLCELLDNIELVEVSPYTMGAILLSISAMAGYFSPSDRKCDVLISVIMPVAFFCFMFVGGFLDKSDLETRFHFYKAVRVAFQPACLVLYPLMAIFAFGASFLRRK